MDLLSKGNLSQNYLNQELQRFSICKNLTTKTGAQINEIFSNEKFMHNIFHARISILNLRKECTWVFHYKFLIN